MTTPWRVPGLSVLMPCRNAGRFLHEALESVLRQPEVLELLVADGDSSDDTVAILNQKAAADSRLRLVSRHDHGPADALNRAASHVRGTVIGWLNADDRFLPGAATRALEALENHPEWLMVYGEGEHIDERGEVLDRYPTLRPEVGLNGFRDYCFVCQPTVFWRRTMGVLLGPFNPALKTTFDFDYWIRAFQAFPERIGHLDALQAQTRRHDATISATQLPRAIMEATMLQTRTFADTQPHMLAAYIEQICRGSIELQAATTPAQHRQQLLQIATELSMPTQQQHRITELLESMITPN
ncbi:MAG: glycosyltransferase [Synechococcaceae cyanobacterium ELA739]|jgi:glycosyltransferase involved in cell wall biosynthesis